MADILQKLFGSSARLKLLRLFLFNPEQTFTIEDATRRTREPRAEVRNEIRSLHSIDFLNRIARRQAVQYSLNPDFTHTLALQSLLLNAPVRGAEVYKKIEKVGSMKLVVISGIFTGDREVALDLFIVGDRINDKKLKNQLRNLEADLGKELRYTYLSSEEFFYRLNMSDRLVRDVFDYPHQIIFDRLDIGLK